MAHSSQRLIQPLQQRICFGLVSLHGSLSPVVFTAYRPLQTLPNPAHALKEWLHGCSPVFLSMQIAKSKGGWCEESSVFVSVNCVSDILNIDVNSH